jgi:serine/threonine-protein kinase
MSGTVDRDSRMPVDVKLPERYEIRRRIASGGMASVWCAEDRTLGRDVAIKLLSEPYAHDPVAVRRFKREARAAARLSSHPHVVTIYDVGEATGSDPDVRRAFLVMEYLAGGTVADALRVGAVSRGDVVRWLQQAAAALDYAHGRGVIHRDIKPANFLLDCDRVLHVADFGIARIGTEETIGSEMLGTAAYLAPERALGRPATESSDRYSLAVAAYELVVGARPFDAENFAAQARHHIEDQPPPPSQRNPALPAAIDGVLARGLAKRPEERWPSAGAFADALERALSGARQRRRRPGAAAAAGSAAAGAAVAGAAVAGAATRPTVVRPPRARHAAPAPAHSLAGPARSRLPKRLGPALAVLAIAAFAVGAALGLTGHSSNSGDRASVTGPSTATHAQAARHRHKPRAKPHHQAPPSTTSSTTATSPTTTNAAATTPPPTADTLEAQGHAQMEAGDYPAAINTLRAALATASPASLTYAYALFDLGRSLRLSGDPRDAVAVLWKRMQIPNQTGAVREELQLALQALGRKFRHSSGAPAPGKGHGHGQAAQQSSANSSQD